MNNIDKYVLNEKNDLLKVPEGNLEKAEMDMGIRIPSELRTFYERYGYGSINDVNSSIFNNLLAPSQCASIRLRRGYYKYDPELETYTWYERNCNRMIFFEVNEGIYLMIDLKGEKNAIYDGNIKIADSLEEFLIKMYDDGAYYEEYVQEQYAKWEAENNE